jgi:hypothetical protein
MATSMGEENNRESEPTEPTPNAGEPSEQSAAAEAAPSAASAKGLTPGQRLAAKKAQKAQQKREFKEELKRKEEEAREKELEEAQRLLSPPTEPALPDEVQKVAGTFSDFMQENRSRIVGGIAAVVLLSLGVILARDYMGRGSAEQAELLTTAIEVSRAPIDPDDADGKTEDGKPVFKTPEDRARKASEAFAAAVQHDPNSLAAQWGRLAQASVELTSGHPDKAQGLYQAVQQASKDQPALEVRALEGLALAAEASGKADEAQKHLEALAKLDKDLSEYHSARLKLAQGDREGAKTLLKGLYDRLGQRADGSGRYLKGEVEARLAELDSSLVERSSGGGEVQQFSPEELQRLIEQLRKQQGGQPDGNSAE